MIKLNLKEVLEERKMSIRQLSFAAGLSYSTTFDIVNQKRVAVNFKNLYSILNALDIEEISEVMEIVQVGENNIDQKIS